MRGLRRFFCFFLVQQARVTLQDISALRASPYPLDGRCRERDAPPERLGRGGPGEPGGQEARAEGVTRSSGVHHPRRCCWN